jgi:hypothetical protein
MFKKGQQVVEVYNVMGSETATIRVVDSSKKGVVSLRDTHLSYDATTGMVVDEDGFPGVNSRIIRLEG